jgi:hypothetical protein
MTAREVTIVTGWGDHLGTGHVQRMANLANHMNSHASPQAYIMCDREPEFLPVSFKDIFSNRIRPGTGIIIRDKRDSSIKEMEELKGHGNVIAIDDCGPGRELADLPVDLLPNLKYSINNTELFIYGYTFTDSIRRLGSHPVRKEIDYALYCGISPSRETVNFILSLIPKDSSCAILSGSRSALMRNGALEPLQKSYAETLISARVLISHFGITLYEGHLAGCRLISMNPTEYHSRLSEIARHDLELINLGVIDAIDPNQARTVVSDASRSTIPGSIDPMKIIKTIETGLDLFLSQLQPFLPAE